MYDAIKEILLDLFKAPSQPPEPPIGDPANTRVFRASPQFLSYQLVSLTVVMMALSLVLFAVIIFVLLQNPLIGLLAGVIAFLLWGLLFVAGYFIVRLEYDMRYYIITDRSLRLRRGVLNIVEQTQTFANVQNIKVEQGPIENLFGIARLVVETAGGGMAVDPQSGQSSPNYHQAVMAGLENAPSIRDLIRNYLRRLPSSSGVDEETQKAAPASPQTSLASADLACLQDILMEIRLLKAGWRG